MLESLEFIFHNKFTQPVCDIKQVHGTLRAADDPAPQKLPLGINKLFLNFLMMMG
jgi:hypothetical protein